MIMRTNAPSRKRKLLGGLFLLGAFSGAAVSSVHAHHSWTGYHYHTASIVVYSGDNLDNSTAQRLRSATSGEVTTSWTAHSDAPMLYGGTRSGLTRTMIYDGGVPASLVADFTNTYFEGHEITNSYTRVSSNIDWYKGTGTPGSGQKDVWSALAHEAGHWLYIGHVQPLNGVNYCPTTNQRPTMCSSLPPESTMMRQPDQDEDKLSANQAY